MTRPELTRAREVQVGDWVYDNRAWNWLDRWPVVTKTEPIAAGRVALHTAQRLFVALADETLLVRQPKAVR